jgi:hypothetical protein
MASQLAMKKKPKDLPKEVLLRKWNFYKATWEGIECEPCTEARRGGPGVNVTDPATSYSVMAKHAREAHGLTDCRGEASIVGRELQKEVDALRKTTDMHTVIEEGIDGWKCGDCPRFYAHESSLKRHCSQNSRCDEAKKRRIPLYRTKTKIMTDTALAEELGKVNSDKVYRAVQARRDDYAWVQQHPEDLVPLLLPSDFSAVAFQRNDPVMTRAMRKKFEESGEEREKELFETIKDLRNVTEDESRELLKRVELIAAAQRKPGAYIDGARYRRIFEGCKSLDIREETENRIRLEVTIPDPSEEDPTKTIETNVYVFDLSKDQRTMVLLRRIGERLHQLRGNKGTVRNKRKDTGPMLGIGHRYNKGRLVLYDGRRIRR